MAIFNPTYLSLRTGQKIQFRHVSKPDVDRYIEFRERVPHESTDTMQYVGMKLSSRDEYAKMLTDQEQDPIILNLGAFDDLKMIGYLSFRVPRADHPWVRHLAQFGMMILKEYWGFGIGKKMLELQETHARLVGVSRIEAMVRVKNVRGVKLYESCGFAIEGTRKKAAKIDGEFFDEYFIAKLFEA